VGEEKRMIRVDNIELHGLCVQNFIMKCIENYLIIVCWRIEKEKGKSSRGG
jgi:ureidoglycolate hydrolase